MHRARFVSETAPISNGLFRTSQAGIGSQSGLLKRPHWAQLRLAEVNRSEADIADVSEGPVADFRPAAPERLHSWAVHPEPVGQLPAPNRSFDPGQADVCY